jgi:mono/diheme cytochrome c family protein
MRQFLIVAATVLPLAAAAQDRQSFDQLERGKYLTTMGDCVACHSAEGGKPFAGGRTIETPFGNLISPNITPDVATGIGAWTDDEFVRAMQHGINRAGQHLYPAFPYVYYTHVDRSDILAIRAWLSTLPPVNNKVVSNQLPFPMNVRADLTAWDAINFKPGEFKPDPKQSPEWNRGAYIVTGLEHCGLCHTPKNVSGGDDGGKFLQGAQLQGWWAPNITGDQSRGIGRWSVEDIVQYLQTGHNQYAAASGPMREEVQQSSYALHEDDLRAIAVYLKSLPGQDDTRSPVAADDPAMKAGEAIYTDQCSACHMRSGKGIPRLFPSLAGAPTVQQPNVTSLERVVLQGAQSAATPGAVTGPAMPSYGWMLSDD